MIHILREKKIKEMNRQSTRAASATTTTTMKWWQSCKLELFNLMQDLLSLLAYGWFDKTAHIYKNEDKTKREGEEREREREPMENVLSTGGPLMCHNINYLFIYIFFFSSIVHTRVSMCVCVGEHQTKRIIFTLPRSIMDHGINIDLCLVWMLARASHAFSDSDLIPSNNCWKSTHGAKCVPHMCLRYAICMCVCMHCLSVPFRLSSALIDAFIEHHWKWCMQFNLFTVNRQNCWDTSNILFQYFQI